MCTNIWRHGCLGADAASRLIQKLSICILSILLVHIILILKLRTIFGQLIVAVACLRLASKCIVLRDGVMDNHTIFFAFLQLLDIEPDLLGQELGQLLINAMPPSEICGQPVWTVAFIDMNVFVLSITNLNCDR